MKRYYLYEGILAAIAGLLLIIFPEFWIRFIVTVLGLSAIAYGVYNLKYEKALFADTTYERTILIRSIVSIVIGVMVTIFPLTLAKAAWNAMRIILIIYLILSATAGFYAAALLKNTDIDRKRYFIENLILVGLAVVLIFLSDNLGVVIMRLVGVIGMIGGIALAVYEIISQKKQVITTDSASDSENEEATEVGSESAGEEE